MEYKYDVFISYRREGGYDTVKHLNILLGSTPFLPESGGGK